MKGRLPSRDPKLLFMCCCEDELIPLLLPANLILLVLSLILNAVLAVGSCRGFLFLILACFYERLAVSPIFNMYFC